MSTMIVLESELGELIESIDDSHSLLLRLILESNIANTCCLRFIDPYGNTIFNRRQMEPLLVELENLHKLIKTREDHEFLSKIELLAHQCKERVHLYIRIIGD